jgi:hypothetical protein
LPPLPQELASRIHEASGNNVYSAWSVTAFRKEGAEMIGFLLQRIFGMFSIAAITIVITHPEMLIRLVL